MFRDAFGSTPHSQHSQPHNKARHSTYHNGHSSRQDKAAKKANQPIEKGEGDYVDYEEV